MAKLLEAGEVPSARVRLSHLCARDATTLDSAELTRAATESIAENTSDAVVAPLFWGAVAGLPGLLGYRALNTLDAMVGYRLPRYEEFGWAAARADDLVNLAPSRFGAALTVACAPLAGGRARQAWRIWRRDGGHHPSPNAGQVEAAFAGALGIRLGGTNSYGGEVERRARLGEGRDPEPVDLRRAVRLSRLVGVAALTVAVVIGAGIGRGRAGRQAAAATVTSGIGTRLAMAAPTTPWGAAPVQSIGRWWGRSPVRRSVDNLVGAARSVDNSAGVTRSMGNSANTGRSEDNSARAADKSVDAARPVERERP